MQSRRLFMGSLTAAVLAQDSPPLFVPADFQVPELYTDPQGKYKLKPLGPHYAKLDYNAYMSSIDHLQKTFTFSTNWPKPGITMAEAIADVEGELAGFKARKKFTYAVLNMRETQELGCVYISPSPKQGYDAQVRMWVTQFQYDLGFEKTLYLNMSAWLKSRWPFEKVAFIGHEIARDAYRALPDKAKK
jgi:hypothetical protein